MSSTESRIIARSTQNAAPAPVAALAEARERYPLNDVYRWAVEILHKLVFADPADTGARELQADAYEQLGYQAEGPQWRGIFLTAARELREGIQPTAFTVSGPKAALVGVLLKPSVAPQLAAAAKVVLEGDAGQLAALGAVLDDFDPAFPLVTP